jgi:hypothetical protein
MGNYNPSLPVILGQEWVPIRDEDLVFSPVVNAFEQGHKFTLAQSRVLQDGRFYIHDQAPGLTNEAVNLINIYPAASINAAGPIQSVIIPCNSGAVTGSTTTITGGSVAAALADPSDGFGIHSTFNAVQQEIGLFFAVNSYSAALTNKRIVGVQFLYTAYAVNDNTAGPFINQQGTTPPTYLFIAADNVPLGIDYGPLTDTLYTATVAQAPYTTPIGSLNMGEVSQFWSTSPGDERLPWKFADLQRFEASAGATRRFFRIVVQMMSNAGDRFFLGYAALRVLYCEETRTAYGGRRNNNNQILGVQTVPLRTATANTLNPVLTAGDYIVTVSAADIGALNASAGAITTYPALNALRELYSIPPHPGTQLKLTTVEGETFTPLETHILPQLSLHTSGGPLTEPHVYGRQAAAHIYGSIIASQEILDPGPGGSSWPQVRYYARRFGDTTVPLLLFSPDITGSGASVSITPTEHDALPEIMDGWKEVTLRFTTPPTMPAGQTRWRWSATGEAAGSRWEVLGAIAPAISGTPGNSLNKVPAPHQLSTATYGAPTQGDTTNLGWVPGYSPIVTSVTDDQTADATLLFSQDPPTITGVAITQLSQTVTGIGLDCGTIPCCIPTGIGYNRVTWPVSSMPITGFGAYELQRWDSVTDWQTIMSASSPAITGFNDFEARVGLASVYRIRITNLYDFAGGWSTQVTGTVASPGVDGCAADGGVLIFTTNDDQTGASNLAYSPGWEGSTEETFDFPEADQVTYQRMYNRDGSVAFHGTERGLEHFTRLLVIQQAAIDPIRLANLRNLRDLAWADHPYVCVRDDVGDRWFASVRVPNERVHQRALYLATVDVTEVTQTAAPIDPS